MARTAKAWRAKGLEGVECLRASLQGERFSRHFHEGYALGVVESGALEFKYLGRDCVAPAGAVNMVVPGEIHDGHGASPQGWRYRMFYLDAEVVECAAGELAGCAVRAPGFPAGVIHDPLLARAIGSLHQDLEDGSTTLLERQGRLSVILSNWISRHSETRRAVRAGPEPAAVKRAKEYLREGFSGPVSLAELSQAAGLSAFRLNRVFSRAVGLAPHAYQVLLRVEKARKLLAAGISPAAVAAETGFADQSHLNRHFRRITGVTPGAYGKIVQDR